jgi:hypothetical protein
MPTPEHVLKGRVYQNLKFDLFPSAFDAIFSLGSRQAPKQGGWNENFNFKKCRKSQYRYAVYRQVLYLRKFYIWPKLSFPKREAPIPNRWTFENFLK